MQLLKVNVNDRQSCAKFDVRKVGFSVPTKATAQHLRIASDAVMFSTSSVNNNSASKLCACLYHVEVVRVEPHRIAIRLPRSFMRDFFRTVDEHVKETIKKSATSWFKNSVNVDAVEDSYRDTVQTDADKSVADMTVENTTNLATVVECGSEYDIKVYLAGIQFNRKVIVPVWHVCVPDIVHQVSEESSENNSETASENSSDEDAESIQNDEDYSDKVKRQQAERAKQCDVFRGRFDFMMRRLVEDESDAQNFAARISKVNISVNQLSASLFGHAKFS